MSDADITRMRDILARQQKAFLNDGAVSAETRIDRLDRAINLVFDNQHALVDAMSADFGNRSRHQSLMSDVYASLESLKHVKQNVRQWMKPERRKVMFPLNLMGAKAHIEYQPKGVVGNITTWNFPVYVAMGPLAGIFGAGNRAMLKLSEVTPNTATLLQQLFAKYFDETECAGITGGPEVGAAFAGLPLDHIIFTGATGVARHILAAAAPNLTPVTLELGGKSPVIISRSADLKETALRIAAGKALNVGQVCLSPDYVFVPEESLEAFVAALQAELSAMFPTIANNGDYSGVVNRRHYDRLCGYLDDARSQGADVRPINPANEDLSNPQGACRLPFTLVIKPTDTMKVMQEELFGPVICIKPYQRVDDCIAHINARPRPLALYYFGKDAAEERHVLDHTISGGVTLNDVMGHVSCENLPFGGIGASGMGNYHGIEGFKTFSHARAVYRATKLNVMKLGGMIPPYGQKTDDGLKRMLKK